MAVADVNGDGRPDIIALSSEEPIVEWYENPGWKPRLVTTKTSHNISLAPLFQRGKLPHGLALAADFSFDDSTVGGSLWWAEPPVPLEGEWALQSIGQIPTSHRLRWGDLDGDGRLELVDAPIFGPGAKAPDFNVGARLTWFAVPEPLVRGHASASEEPVGAWESHLIDDTLPVTHGIRILDWDGDGRDEILTASAKGLHVFHSSGRGGKLRWTRTQLASGLQPGETVSNGSSKELHRGSSEIGVGKVAGKRFLASIEPWHGEQVVVYLEKAGSHPGDLWEPHVIDSSFHDGHALMCADFDGDGNDEIVAGYRGPGTSLFLYSATDSTGVEWKRETLDTGMATACLAIEDLNGDGRLDIVAIGASTGNVKWYENRG